MNLRNLKGKNVLKTGKLIYNETASRYSRKYKNERIIKMVFYLGAACIIFFMGLYLNEDPTKYPIAIFFGIGFILLFILTVPLFITHLKIYENGISPEKSGIIRKKEEFIHFNEIEKIYTNTNLPKFIGGRNFVITLKNRKYIILYMEERYRSFKKIERYLYNRVSMVSNRVWLYKKGEYFPPPETIEFSKEGLKLNFKEESMFVKWKNIRKLRFYKTQEIILKDGTVLKIAGFHSNPKKHLNTSNTIKREFNINKSKAQNDVG